MDRDKARAEGALYHLGDLRIAAAVRWEARAALGDSGGPHSGEEREAKSSEIQRSWLLI